MPNTPVYYYCKYNLKVASEFEFEHEQGLQASELHLSDSMNLMPLML